MHVAKRLLPLAVVVLWALGCQHRQTAPDPAVSDGTWYRRQNLFAAFDPDARGVSLSNAYLLELACFVGDKGSFELDRTLETWGFDRRREFRDIQTSTYGYVASNDRMVLVTFGGTDILNLRDGSEQLFLLEGFFELQQQGFEQRSFVGQRSGPDGHGRLS